jgi:hypothetical protein
VSEQALIIPGPGPSDHASVTLPFTDYPFTFS